MHCKASGLLLGIEFILQILQLIVKVSGNQFALLGKKNILSVYKTMSLKFLALFFISFK